MNAKSGMLVIPLVLLFANCGGKVFFFADSKRPGHIAGPYDSVAAFIGDYARYRGRRIVSYRELESYRRQQHMEAPQPGGHGKKKRPIDLFSK